MGKITNRPKTRDERRAEYFRTREPDAVGPRGTPLYFLYEDPANTLDQELLGPEWFENPAAQATGRGVPGHETLRRFLARQWAGYPGPDEAKDLAAALRGERTDPDARRWVQAFLREVGDRGLGANELRDVMTDEGISAARMAQTAREAECRRGLVVNALHEWARPPRNLKGEPSNPTTTGRTT